MKLCVSLRGRWARQSRWCSVAAPSSASVTPLGISQSNERQQHTPTYIRNQLSRRRWAQRSWWCSRAHLSSGTSSQRGRATCRVRSTGATNSCRLCTLQTPAPRSTSLTSPGGEAALRLWRTSGNSDLPGGSGHLQPQSWCGVRVTTGMCSSTRDCATAAKHTLVGYHAGR